jgi:hypothetical protein
MSWLYVLGASYLTNVINTTNNDTNFVSLCSAETTHQTGESNPKPNTINIHLIY